MSQMNTAVSAITEEQWWIEIHEFVQDDDYDDLGVLMLDGTPDHWDQAYEAGLTPQQAIEIG